MDKRKNAMRIVFIVSTIFSVIFVALGLGVIFQAISADLLAPGAYNAPYAPYLIDQIFGTSVLVMGVVIFDVGQAGYLGLKKESTNYYLIRALVFVFLSALGIVCSAFRGAFGLVYVIFLIISIVYLIIAKVVKYPVDPNSDIYDSKLY